MSIRDFKITPEQIAEKGVIAAPDTLTGTPNENKSVFDRLASEIIVPSVNGAIEMLGDVEDDTLEWASDEAERKANELQRQQNEQERITAEQARQAAEALRQNTFAAEVAQAQEAAETAEAEADRAQEEADRAAAIVGGDYLSRDELGQPNGVASLGPDGKVPEAQLPEMDYAPSEHTHSAADITSGELALARGGTGAGTAQGARNNLEVAKPVRTTVSIPTSGWALSSSVYKQTVSCSVAKETMKYANIGPQYSTDASARKLEQEAYALIAYIDTADGSLTATCWGNEKPAVNLTLIFEGGVD